jgi:hypothetical protein
MPRAPSTATFRLASLAWDVIDNAYHESREQPLERTTLHKLALGFLQIAGFAGGSQVRIIWKMLGHEGDFQQPPCRQAYYGPVIHGIRDRITMGKRL